MRVTCSRARACRRSTISRSARAASAAARRASSAREIAASRRCASRFAAARRSARCSEVSAVADSADNYGMTSRCQICQLKQGSSSTAVIDALPLGNHRIASQQPNTTAVEKGGQTLTCEDFFSPAPAPSTPSSLHPSALLLADANADAAASNLRPRRSGCSALFSDDRFG